MSFRSHRILYVDSASNAYLRESPWPRLAQQPIPTGAVKQFDFADSFCQGRIEDYAVQARHIVDFSFAKAADDGERSVSVLSVADNTFCISRGR